jgi:hypothetical protein
VEPSTNPAPSCPLSFPRCDRAAISRVSDTWIEETTGMAVIEAAWALVRGVA